MASTKERVHLVGIVVIMTMFFVCTEGQTYDNMTKLLSDVMANYNPEVRPLFNQSEVLNVNLTLFVYGLVEVDSVKGILTFVLSTYCTWYDEKLVWNPNDYGGINTLLLKMDSLWTPVIALGTPIEFTTMGKSYIRVHVMSNGFATFNPGEVIRSSCSFNVKFWPFDKQVCDVSFFAMDYTPDQLMIRIPSNGLQITYVSGKNSEWTLEDHSYRERAIYGSAEAIFRLKLKRQSLFYVLSIILPLSGMFLVSPLVFLLPEQSGERVSYCITIMLALAVFLTMVTAEMPKTSDPPSLMCIYILLGMMNSSVIMVIVILNMRWGNRSEKTIPGSWLKLLVRLSQCRTRNQVSDVAVHENEKLQEKMKIHDKLKIDDHVFTMTDISNKEDNYVRVREQPKESAEIECDITWRDVSNAIDMISFVFFFIFSLVSTVAFLVYMKLASSYVEPN